MLHTENVSTWDRLIIVMDQSSYEPMSGIYVDLPVVRDVTDPATMIITIGIKKSYR